MENKQLSMIDLIIETHIGLERQGPGSTEMTLKALSFVKELDENSQVIDLGCGTGGQTMVLAQHIKGSITGIDQFQEFIDVFNDNAKKLNLQERVMGIVGIMEDLSFSKGEIDLIWSEGVVDSISFEKNLSYWNKFLKEDGYIALTIPSWFTDEHPAEVAKFWTDMGSGLDTIGNNISVMQKAGYIPVATFTLPEKCWTDNYYVPRMAAEAWIMKKYPGNKIVEDYIKNDIYEVNLYSKYKQHYGYVFYIGKKYR